MRNVMKNLAVATSFFVVFLVYCANHGAHAQNYHGEAAFFFSGY